MNDARTAIRARIETIEKSRNGSLVTLRDGRSFELSDTNDVDSGNRGIFIEDGTGTYKVRWSDFRELRLAR